MRNERDGRPLLLLDMDGPLNPYRSAPHERPAGYSTHRMRPTGWENPRDKPLRVWLNHGHGADLDARGPEAECEAGPGHAERVQEDVGEADHGA